MTATPRADEPFDTGLQPERTALAWRRTALSLTVGGLFGLRILPQYWNTSGLVVAGFAVVLSLLILVLAHFRYRITHQRLTSDGPVFLPGGALSALTAAVTTAAGVAGLVLALHH